VAMASAGSCANSHFDYALRIVLTDYNTSANVVLIQFDIAI